MSVGFSQSLTNISAQYFSEALFLDQIPSCLAKTKSGERLYLIVYLPSYCFSGCDVTLNYITYMN